MNYSIRIWNNDDLIKEINLSCKKYSRKLITEAKAKALIFKGQFTVVDLCKNNENIFALLYARN